MTGVEPELWVGDPAAAIDFYVRAFGATVNHRVGFGNDIVAQLCIGDARIWVSNAGSRRFDPRTIGGTTSRTLLVTDEHGWRLGRIIDPSGHEWEIGHPLGDWPP